MCSTTRGPAIWPAHLAHGAGRGFDPIGPHGLDRIHHDQARRRAFGKRCHDVLDRGFGGKLDRGLREAEPLGPQPHLRNRFLAGDVDGAMAGAGDRGGGLDQQR